MPVPIYLNIPLTYNEIKNIENFHKEKLIIKDGKVVKEKGKTLEEIFTNDKNKRDIQISFAFYHGYKQSEIARYLGLSSSTISKIINKSGN